MKSCLECEHWDLDPGEPNYSEYTPGYPMNIRCIKSSEWNSRDWDIEEDMQRDMLRAETCSDFQPIDLDKLKKIVFGEKT